MIGNGVFRGFVWTPGQGYTALGTLGGVSSYAMAINNSGDVAGSAQMANGSSHAFAAYGTNMIDLGTLGGMASYAYGINDQGNVAGYSWMASNATTDGFLEEGGVMYDINSLLIDAPGWDVTALYGINNSNQVVGVGILNGVEHAVLLTDPPAPDSDTSIATPEPAAWICTSSGLALLLFGRALLGLFFGFRGARGTRGEPSAMMRFASVACSLATRTSSGRFGMVWVPTTMARSPTPAAGTAPRAPPSPKLFPPIEIL